MKTIAMVPESSTNKFLVTVNDRDFDIVSRNAILLLVALVAENVEQAAECMIHVWYSAMISRTHMELLRGPVRKLVEDVCYKITGRDPSAVLAKTWRFDSSTLRLVLTKEQWSSLLACFDVPASFTSDHARQIRTSITMAHERRDHRDRALFTRPPMHRICAIKFREEGVLLPFGSSRAPFNKPNPTLFRSEEWPMKDSADPLEGWAYTDMLGGPATNDIYGRLFSFLMKLLSDFYRRLKSLHVDFQMFNVDAQKLDLYLQGGTFARVEVSIVSQGRSIKLTYRRFRTSLIIIALVLLGRLWTLVASYNLPTSIRMRRS